MTQEEILRHRLKEMDATIRGIDVPEDANPSAEDLARTINQSLDAIERGDFELLNDDDD